MDGLSLVLTLLFYRVAGSLIVIIASPMLVWLGRKRIALNTRGRGGFLWVCGLAPLAAVLWVWVCFVGYSYVNRTIFHQDDGLTDDPYVTLPDNFVIGKQVDYCWGYIAGSGQQTHGFDKCHSPDGRGLVSGVTEVQIADHYILGTRSVADADPNFLRGGAHTVTSYFLLDRRTGSVEHFASKEDLSAAASSKGIDMSPEYIGLTYARHRVHWIDWLLVPAQLFGVAGLLAFLLFWYKRLLRPYNEIES